MFVDRGASTLRHVPISRLEPARRARSVPLALATFPSAGLLACFDQGKLFVLDEEGTVVHQTGTYYAAPVSSKLSFFSADTLAVHHWCPATDVGTEIWRFSADGGLIRTGDDRPDPIRDWWPDAWHGKPLEADFARFVYTADWLDDGVPWLRAPAGLRLPCRELLTISAWGDAYAVVADGWTDHGRRSHHHMYIEVHAPHLPAVRALLERPMLHCTPQELRHVRQLRTQVACVRAGKGVRGGSEG